MSPLDAETTQPIPRIVGDCRHIGRGGSGGRVVWANPFPTSVPELRVRLDDAYREIEVLRARLALHVWSAANLAADLPVAVAQATAAGAAGERVRVADELASARYVEERLVAFRELLMFSPEMTAIV